MHKSLLIVLLAGASWGQTKTVWDGIYTTAQAERGKAVFDEHCLHCHTSRFEKQGIIERWREEKLSGLVDFISVRMPRDSPGTRTPSEYLDLAAYILSNNEIPAGAQELTAAAALTVQVQKKEGPAPLPVDTVYQVVGCLVQGPGNTWKLTHAGDPVRTRESSRSIKAALKTAEAQPLGTRTYNVPNIEVYGDDPPKSGQRAEAKGYPQTRPDGERLLLTALQTIAGDCPE